MGIGIWVRRNQVSWSCFDWFKPYQNWHLKVISYSFRKTKKYCSLWCCLFVWVWVWVQLCAPWSGTIPVFQLCPDETDWHCCPGNFTLGLVLPFLERAQSILLSADNDSLHELAWWRCSEFILNRSARWWKVINKGPVVSGWNPPRKALRWEDTHVQSCFAGSELFSYDLPSNF